MELTHIFSPTVILIWIGLIGYGYVCWQQPRYGLYILSGLLPVYLIRPTIFGLPTTVLELGILILFACWILKDAKWKNIRLPLTKAAKEPGLNAIPREYRLPLIAFLIAGFLGFITAGSSVAAFGILKAYVIEPFLVLIVFAYEIKSLNQLKIIFRALGFMTIALGAIGFFQYWSGLGITNPYWAAVETRRATSIFGYPNAASLLVAPIIALFAGYLSFKKMSLIEMVFSILVICFGILAILAAKTTGALIALGGIAFLELLRRKQTRSLGIGLALIIITLFLNSPTVIEKTSHLGTRIQANILDLDSSSLEIRVNQWRETLTFLADKPILGAGLTNYQTALKPYHQYDFLEIYLYPHNIFLNFWVEMGLLGLLSVLWLMFVIAKNLTMSIRNTINESRKKFAIAISYAWIVIFIHGLVDVPYFKNDLSVFVLLLLGMTVIVSLSEKERSALKRSQT